MKGKASAFMASHPVRLGKWRAPGRIYLYKKKREPHRFPPFLRKMGLEPTRHCWHKILSLARLPIPTLPHAHQ